MEEEDESSTEEENKLNSAPEAQKGKEGKKK